ncbi:hypothetical protein ACFSTC_51030 [Nonomuraea ferruginea]
MRAHRRRRAVLGMLDVTGGRGSLGRRLRAESPGVFTAMVPRSVYSVTGALAWVDPSTYLTHSAWLLAPEFEVSGDAEITLDARDAREIRFGTPEPSVPSPESQRYTYVQETLADGSIWYHGTSSAPFVRHWATPTKKTTKGKVSLTTSVGQAAPEVTMKVRGRDGFALHPEVFPHVGDIVRNYGVKHVPFTGKLTAKLVDVGIGTPEKLAGLDLRGKLALLDDEGNCGGRPERFHAIRDAGAAGILMWPSGPLYSCGLGPFIPQPVWIQPDDGVTEIGIPYVSVSPTEARALRERLAKGAVSIDVHGRPHSPYAYGLHHTERGRVPAKLSYELTGLSSSRPSTPATTPRRPRPTRASRGRWRSRTSCPSRPCFRRSPPRARASSTSAPSTPRRSSYARRAASSGPCSAPCTSSAGLARLTHHWNAGPFTPSASVVPDDVYRTIDPLRQRAERRDLLGLPSRGTPCGLSTPVPGRRASSDSP